MNFDSYYDAPDDNGLENTIEALIEVIEYYPVADANMYDEEFRKESVLLESIAMMLNDNTRLLNEFIAHVHWVKSGCPSNVNVYEANADLYDFS